MIDFQYYDMTELWITAGRDLSKKPIKWLHQKATVEYLNVIKEKIKSNFQSPLTKTKYGRVGGTFGIWMVYLAYAKYLSPEIHYQVNAVFTKMYPQYINQINNTYIEIADKEQKWLDIRNVNKQCRIKFSETLKEHEVTPNGQASCTNVIYKEVLGDKASNIKKELAITGSLRDALPIEQLSLLGTVECYSALNIEKYNIRGNIGCKNTCSNIAKIFANTVKGLNNES